MSKYWQISCLGARYKYSLQVFFMAKNGHIKFDNEEDLKQNKKTTTKTNNYTFMNWTFLGRPCVLGTASCSSAAKWAAFR